MNLKEKLINMTEKGNIKPVYYKKDVDLVVAELKKDFVGWRVFDSKEVIELIERRLGK